MAATIRVRQGGDSMMLQVLVCFELGDGGFGIDLEGDAGVCVLVVYWKFLVEPKY